VRWDTICPGRGKCPSPPCPVCYLEKREQAENTAAGRILRQALDTRAALQMRVRVPIDDIPADEYALLRLIETEVGKWQDDPENPKNQKR